jgi:exopolysaccharide biosynthesis polyprenyl glycosylphosphotransferase
MLRRGQTKARQGRLAQVGGPLQEARVSGLEEAVSERSVAATTTVPLLPPRQAAPRVRRESTRRRTLAIADAAALSVAWTVATATAGMPSPWPLAAIALPAWILLNKLLGLYDRDANLIHKSTLDELPRVLQSMLLGSAAVCLVAPVDRGSAIAFALAGAASVPALRFGVRRVVQRTFPPERALIVGSGRVATIVARKIRAHPEYGVQVVGAVDVTTDDDPRAGDFPILGELERLEELCEELRVERVVIAFSSLSHEHLLDAIRLSKTLDIRITVVPRLFEVIGGSVEIDQLEGMTLLGLRGLGRTRSSLALKRAIDIAGSALGLLVLAPLLAGIALAVWLDSGRPVLYSHERIGRDNRRFRLWKFRTMIPDADLLKSALAHLNEASSPMFKIADDPRVTRVGRFLRRTSLDELPQLLNVLRGEMSLVGPRPLVPDEDDHVIGWHRTRLAITPGLTGPWQVMGRTAIPFEEMIKLDYLYVADWSLWNDMKLLVRTAPVVVGGKGS